MRILRNLPESFARACSRALLVGSLAVGALGCDGILGIHDHDFAPASEGGAPNDGSAASDTQSGVDSAVGTDAGGDATGPGSDGGAADGGCATGALACSGNTPEQCDGGAWQPLPACGGATPLCSNGVCGTFRTTGGIRSTAPSPIADAGIRLVAGGFELGKRTCSDAGVCVTGGIAP